MTVIPRTDVFGTYEVWSKGGVHDVDLREPFSPTCSCADFLWRDRLCKHIAICQRYRDGETDD